MGLFKERQRKKIKINITQFSLKHCISVLLSVLGELRSLTKKSEKINS